MISADQDKRWMQRALKLASRGITPPNPMVGCIIVSDGRIVGEGYHVAAGLPHAEVNALQQAGDLARGATVYVTLEPCCHWGRTPPCADALISAGVKRVVVAGIDPNPQVSGRGIDRLKSRGILVEVGLFASDAAALNAAFLHFHTQKSPYTTIKSAITLDGKTATVMGGSQWISGKESRCFVHKLRAQSGAVMTGIGTILADNPFLTSRISPAPPLQPLRIIVDSRLRTPTNCKAIQISSASSPLLIVTTYEVSSEAAARIGRDGVETLRLPAKDSKVDLSAMMEVLTERQIISVLVEGGGELNAALLKQGLAHKVLFFIAPTLFGGRSAPTAVEGDGVQLVSDAIHLRDVRVRKFGVDYAYEAAIDTEADKTASAGRTNSST